MSIIRTILTEPPKSNIHSSVKYIFLLFILTLLAFYSWIFWITPASYPHDRYSGFVIGFMLLFNLLAFQFPWQPVMTAVLRMLSAVWTLFGVYYIFYLSHILFK